MYFFDQNSRLKLSVCPERVTSCSVCARTQSNVSSVPVPDALERLQLVHDGGDVRLDEGQLALVLAVHLPPEVAQAGLQILKVGPLVVLEQVVARLEVVRGHVAALPREQGLELLFGKLELVALDGEAQGVVGIGSCQTSF